MTAGGEAPGINRCLRAVLPMAWSHGLAVTEDQCSLERLAVGDFVESVYQLGGR